MNEKIAVELDWFELDDLIMSVQSFLNDTKPTKENGDMYHEERVCLNKVHKKLVKSITQLTKMQVILKRDKNE